MNSIKERISDKEKNVLISDDKINLATITKLEFMNKYVDSWSQKVSQSNLLYDELIFVDCMSNSGAYSYEEKIIYSQNLKVPFISINKKLTCIFNDNNVKNINNLKSNIRLCEDKIENQCYYYELDKNEFINDMLIPYLESLKSKGIKFQVLCYYDPYKLDFDWEILTQLLNYNIDFIFTHFWGNHGRYLSENSISKNEELKKYYLMTDEEICEFHNIEKYFKRKEYCIEKLKKIFSNNKKYYISYVPNFNSKNSDLYDIFVVSVSIESKKLLKTIMYGLQKDKLDINKIYQYKLFDNETPPEKSYEIYMMDNMINVIRKDLSGKKIKPFEFKEYINNHEFLPCIIKEFKAMMKEQGFMIIIKKDRKEIEYQIGEYYE